MKKIFYCLLAATSMLLPFTEIYAVAQNTVEGAESDNFNRQLEDQIAKQQKHVQEMMAKATSRTQMPMWADKVELEQAIIMLDVKRILYGNFRNTPSLQSPVVRQKLLQVMSQDNITEGDLAELQSLVNSEKRQLLEQQVQQQQQPTPPVQQSIPQPVQQPAPQNSQLELTH